MAKTTVSTIIQKIKRRADYSITDNDLDDLIIDLINDSLKEIRQLCYDYELYQDISKQVTFKTTYKSPYTDIEKAMIVGDQVTFTGVAGDKIKVTIDGTAYDNINVSACTSISDVVTAINSAVGSTVASSGDLVYLVITSPTTGASSNVTIADGALTVATCVARLFSDSTQRTQSAIADLDEILMISERTYKFALQYMEYADFVAMYPDPDSIRAVVPDIYARWFNRIYWGPTPNAYSLMYMDYLFDLTEITNSGSLPLDNKYDPLIIAMCGEEFVRWLDSTNVTGIAAAKAKRKELVDELIIKASKNVKMNRQTSSRRNMIPYFSPRKKIVA